MTFKEKINLIECLVEDGILGPEECPEMSDTGGSIWSWTILKPECIPSSLKSNIHGSRIWV